MSTIGLYFGNCLSAPSPCDESVVSCCDRQLCLLLFFWQLKSLRLKELANDIENQRRMSDSKGKKVVSEEAVVLNDHPEHESRSLRGHDQEKLDEM